MKCPHCHTSISVFSKEMNRFGKRKLCPHCGEGVTLGVRFASVALWFIPAIAISLVLHRWLGGGATALATVFLLLLSLRLKPAA
ncbi:hypothetical protein [Rhodanobacter fulvus]|jgi:hypothetical protein|nr:hypothetical protein [Rhodanobacter fulvus]